MENVQRGNTNLSTRDRYKNSQIAHDKFPPCDDMPYLITRLNEQGFKVGGKILDAGCGQGRFGRYMAQIAGITDVLGIDESHDAINVANTRVPGRAASIIEFQNTEVLEFLKKNQRKRRFDIIGAFNLLEYVEDPKEVLKKLIAALPKHHGFLIGSVYVGNVLPHSTNHWQEPGAFIKEFPELTIVDMKNPDLGCVVFMYKQEAKAVVKAKKVATKKAKKKSKPVD